MSVAVVQRKISRTYSQSQAKEKTKSWLHIPGPSSLPIIGQFHHFLPGSPLYECSGFDFQNHLYSNYGPIVKLDKLLGREPIIFIFDAETSAQVLRGENWLPNRPGFPSLEYYRKHYSKQKRDPSKPAGLVNDTGENWKNLRAMVNPILLRKNIIKLYTSDIIEIAEDMVNRIRLRRNKRNIIEDNFNIEMNLWALESISVIALGRRLNCFNPNLSNDSPEKRLIQIVNDFFVTVDKLDFKPNFWRYVSTPTFRKAMKLYENQESISQHLIQEAMASLRVNNNIKGDREKGVLEKLIDIDKRIAVILAGDTLFGGVDTTANTMTSTLYLLSQNQEKQNILREELRLGGTDYLKACLKESLRMLPVTMGIIRKTTKECSLLGFDIPKNMNIFFGHQLLSMMESHFPRPREFLPERWLVDKNDPLYFGQAHPFAYTPFGFGARSCIGRRIADLELETLLTKMIENFHVEWFAPHPKFKFSTLNYMVPPYNFIFNDIK